MALSDTNMRLNPKSLVIMNYTIVTSVKNSSREVLGSLRWKLVVLGGFGRSPDFRAKSEFARASQIPAKIPAKFRRPTRIPAKFARVSQIPAKIPAKFRRPTRIPAKFPRPARFQPKSQSNFPVQPEFQPNFPRPTRIPAKFSHGQPNLCQISLSN